MAEARRGEPRTIARLLARRLGQRPPANIRPQMRRRPLPRGARRDGDPVPRRSDVIHVHHQIRPRPDSPAGAGKVGVNSYSATRPAWLTSARPTAPTARSRGRPTARFGQSASGSGLAKRRRQRPAASRMTSTSATGRGTPSWGRGFSVVVVLGRAVVGHRCVAMVCHRPVERPDPRRGVGQWPSNPAATSRRRPVMLVCNAPTDPKRLKPIGEPPPARASLDSHVDFPY